VFTPPVLVDFILERAGFVAGPELLQSALVEPACGDGAFLVAAARRLADSVDAACPRGRAGRLAEAIVRNLWGIDVDPGAAAAARRAVRGFFEERTGRKPPRDFFERNVVVSDFLLDDEIFSLPPVAENRLSFMVGTPPYVSTTDLARSHKTSLRERFSTARGRIDLYGLFIERSIGLLPMGGVLSFIVPDKFLQSRSGRPLRTLLLRAGSLHSIVRFASHKVFDDAATVPCVVVFQRGGSAVTFRAMDCESNAAPSLYARLCRTGDR
jgi:hypothetical protein